MSNFQHTPPTGTMTLITPSSDPSMDIVVQRKYSTATSTAWEEATRFLGYRLGTRPFYFRDEQPNENKALVYRYRTEDVNGATAAWTTTGNLRPAVMGARTA